MKKLILDFIILKAFSLSKLLRESKDNWVARIALWLVPWAVYTKWNKSFLNPDIA